MTRTTRVAQSTARQAGRPIETNSNPFDGKVTFTGFHGKLSKAKGTSVANLLVQTRPPFSAFARNVKQHANGVTAYDITPAGPPFAYQVKAASQFEVGGKKYSLVEIHIGPDKQTGAKSAYEGRAYELFSEGPDGAWAAELWDDVKATNAFTDTAANLHNDIVDGKVGQGGFRGLAKKAEELEKSGQAPTRAGANVPQVQTSDSLLKFIADKKAIPGLSNEDRAGLLKALRAAQ